MSNLSNKTVLVTGAHGFLGRHTARTLAQMGCEVIGIGHGDWAPETWRRWGISEWHACEVSLENMLVYAREPAAIFHFAGSGAVGFSLTHPAQDYKRTVEGTLHVLEFIRLHASGARLIYPSSAGVYGCVESLPITEDFPLAPVSPYGVHKKMTEDLIRSYSRHFGVSSAIIRFFSVYGPELRKQLLWDACRKAKRLLTTFPGTGQETRDWLHVSDAASLAFAAMNHASTECPIVNGGFGVSATVRDVLDHVFSLVQPGARIDFSGQARPGDPRDYRADITRARSFGWQPAVDWRSGIRDYVEWFLGDAENKVS